MKINQIDFKLIDPFSAGEEWAEDVHNPPSVVEIYIDGIEILEIFREIETPYCKAEGHPDLVVGYGHVSAKDLYTDLIEATDENSWAYKLGVYPLVAEVAENPVAGLSLFTFEKMKIMFGGMDLNTNIGIGNIIWSSNFSRKIIP